MSYHIGFTGTRHGVTHEQSNTLYRLLRAIREEVDTEIVLHHGDCVGADQTSHEHARLLGFSVEIHPPENHKQRAFCTYPGKPPKVHMEKPYLERNLDIVKAADVLFATPATVGEVFRGSGTWATIRYGRKHNKPTIIIWLDGSTEEENI